jgi:hypothetical protein
MLPHPVPPQIEVDWEKYKYRKVKNAQYLLKYLMPIHCRKKIYI